MNFFRYTLAVIFLDIDAHMGIEEEDIDTIEPGPVHLCFGCQLEHRIQVDAWFGAGAAFADKAGPHRVVKFGKIVAVAHERKPFSKCSWLKSATG
jgi:hypothetical protein